ncbi:hypothetical protein COU57_01880 [Candidatus Pacearchaeota archaeon CG10_big_fil_rev_8_21_14_0_10_32_14]|nr:MAG: hypothetical protein COU57_01880 [Candidatus Pacearchaeota archaeon CG10_big_fil_rev_8_21_14_0_10_32_14]
MEEEKIKFVKIYSNLPDKIRKQDIIVVIEQRPYTWNAVYFEINNNTVLGKKILKKLKEMDII